VRSAPTVSPAAREGYVEEIPQVLWRRTCVHLASLEVGWKNKRKHPSSNVNTQYFWHAQLFIMEVSGFYRGHEAQDITR